MAVNKIASWQVLPLPPGGWDFGCYNVIFKANNTTVNLKSRPYNKTCNYVFFDVKVWVPFVGYKELIECMYFQKELNKNADWDAILQKVSEIVIQSVETNQ